MDPSKLHVRYKLVSNYPVLVYRILGWHLKDGRPTRCGQTELSIIHELSLQPVDIRGLSPYWNGWEYARILGIYLYLCLKYLDTSNFDH